MNYIIGISFVIKVIYRGIMVIKQRTLNSNSGRIRGYTLQGIRCTYHKHIIVKSGVY